jgi:hypothetical protein
MAHQGQVDPRPDGVVLNMEGMTITASRSYLPQSNLTPCPSRGLEVRYLYVSGHQPACEIWKNGKPLSPPPNLLVRANKEKNDSYLREGDTLDYGSIQEKDLKDWGFDEKSNNPIVTLLFFIMDLGSETDYRILFTLKKISPKLQTQWDGSVVIARSISAGSAIMPVPNQSGYDEDLKPVLVMKEIVDPMVALANVIEGFEGMMLDFVWGLTGGLEVEVAGEVAEKYVTREVMRRVLKYVRPKFRAVVKAYSVAFVKEMAKQIFQRILDAIRMAASQKLFATVVPADGAITVEAIHWLASSKKLSDDLAHSNMDWEKCHSLAMEEALKPFFTLFDKSLTKGKIRRFLNKCTEPIEKFFFRHGLLAVIKKAEGMIGQKINSLIVEVPGWIKEWVKPGKPLTAEEFNKLTANKVDDGMLVNLIETIVKYFEDNWEKFAKSALETAQKEFMNLLRGAAE